jgi:Protein of unknown function (DUF3102)
VAGMAGSVYAKSSILNGSSALATVEAEAIEFVRGDEDLAGEINAEHGLVETYKHNTIEHAIRCGELLREMKRRVGHGNWLAWVQEHFQASERTARNYMEIAKSAAVADLNEDTTMRSALRALASPSQPREPKLEPTDAQAAGAPAGERIPIAEEKRIPDAEVLEEPRAGLGKTERRTWTGLPARLGTIKRALGEAAGEELDDHSAGEALYAASREAHQAATDLEQLAAALTKRAA